MFKNRKTKKMEDGLLFTFILTFIGGYMNAYSYFVRGGSLVTMQSGNMARIGLAVYMKDTELFVVSIIPIMGCFFGVTMFQIARRIKKNKKHTYWQRSSMYAEIILFFAVGLIPMGHFDHTVNFTIALASGFQLCNVKNYGGYTHTTTLGSGNVRNLGQIFGDAIVDHDAKSIKLFLEYFIIMFTFTIGAFLGSIISAHIGKYSIWVCGTLMFVLLMYFYKKQHERILIEQLEAQQNQTVVA